MAGPEVGGRLHQGLQADQVVAVAGQVGRERRAGVGEERDELVPAVGPDRVRVPLVHGEPAREGHLVDGGDDAADGARVDHGAALAQVDPAEQPDRGRADLGEDGAVRRANDRRRGHAGRDRRLLERRGLLGLVRRRGLERLLHRPRAPAGREAPDLALLAAGDRPAEAGVGPDVEALGERGGVGRGQHQASSSRCNGVPNRGLTRVPPNQAVRSAAARSTAPAASRPDVLEQLVDDLAVGSLRPAADDAPVHPHGRPGVAAAVEEPGSVGAEVPAPPLPAHRRRVQRGQQRHPRRRPAHRGPRRRDGPSPIPRRGRPRPRRWRPARPWRLAAASTRSTSLMSISVAGPERGQPAVEQGRPRLGRRHPGDAVGQPLVHRHPAVLRARPPALGPAAHDALLGRQQEQHPRRQPDQPLPLLALAEQQLLAQLGDGLRELGAGPSLAAVEGGDRLGLGAAEPAGTVLGDAVGLDQPDQLPALGHGQRVGARGLDDGHEIEGDDEHRPPHAQGAHQRPPLVERVLQRGDRGRRPGQAGGGGEEDRRRVGAVQADQVTGQGRDVTDLGAGGEVVAPTEPGAAFGVADVPHPPGARAQASAGSNRWYSVSSSSAPAPSAGRTSK